ncbi:hypothetical protein F7734_28920 [Scytonema sp. UIC 10036]|uniref:hypothetical protein n=1 Tax=Scytonema sp. UIC 10036 TaxID=2304196 RepID=UPI0012DA6BD5|nr:hypothetical protein [Scytonema sp. UIC 10036]MUG96146.1 hypothetical protein [Scytonema sp. UIC 10036]
MKKLEKMKIIHLFLLVIVFLAISSTSENKQLGANQLNPQKLGFSRPTNFTFSDNPMVATVETKSQSMDSLNISVDDIKLTLMAPKGAKIIKNSWGSIEIYAGKNFQIEIWAFQNENNMMVEFKKEIENNESNRLQRYLINEANVILYESNVYGHSQYHLRSHKMFGNQLVTCENLKGEFFSESEARLMLKSCLSIAQKK